MSSCKKSAKKQGGSIMDDVNKLVVPFGLLLAERSLDKMVKKETKKTSSTKKTTVAENRKAAVGGAKKSTKKQKAGSGSTNISNEFNKLSNEIKDFLSAY